MGWLRKLDTKIRDIVNPSIEVRRERHDVRMETLEHQLEEQKLKEKIFDSRNKIDSKRAKLRASQSKTRPQFGGNDELPEFSSVLFGPDQVKRGNKNGR